MIDIKKDKISFKKILDQYINKNNPSFKLKVVHTDHVLAFIFDLNFKKSYTIVKENNDINR